VKMKSGFGGKIKVSRFRFEHTQRRVERPEDQRTICAGRPRIEVDYDKARLEIKAHFKWIRSRRGDQSGDAVIGIDYNTCLTCAKLYAHRQILLL